MSVWTEFDCTVEGTKITAAEMTALGSMSSEWHGMDYDRDDIGFYFNARSVDPTDEYDRSRIVAVFAAIAHRSTSCELVAKSYSERIRVRRVEGGEPEIEVASWEPLAAGQKVEDET